MDATSARRSSRANRASQPLPSTSHHSSTSSNSSGRADRATRSNPKTESPRKSTPSRSLSSEPPEDTITTAPEDSMQTRRKRGRVEERDKTSKTQTPQLDIINGTEEVIEDDEAVRCICGFDDYPGPPQLNEEDNKHGVREGIEEPIIAAADVTEDLAGFFLQCDECKVWQHGGCVGIMNEEQSPDEYFCEQCRKDLHKIYSTPSGQHYSHYLPLYQSLSRTTSRAASFSKDGTRSPRGSKNGRRQSSSLPSAKRRSTMNSRDAAYDEEEQLRRAIEESKVEKSGESTDGATRRGKRGRSDSEEKQDGVKRQRTTSASPSPSREQRRFTSQADSDDGTTPRPTGAKKIRGAAARNHREKELREERERLRLEAKKKREGRAERRRVDDSDPGEDIPLARAVLNRNTEVSAQPLDPPLSSQVEAPDTPPPNQPSTSHKKGGRPPNSRKGKLGKNQYTKDRDRQETDDQSPGRSQSRDVVRGDENGHGSGNRGSVNDGKHAKSKGSGHKITMTDLKKRAAGLLTFITRTQLEMAESSLPDGDDDSGLRKSLVEVAGAVPAIRVEDPLAQAAGKSPSPEFESLSCLQMMDVLSKRLIKWQEEFAA